MASLQPVWPPRRSPILFDFFAHSLCNTTHFFNSFYFLNYGELKDQDFASALTLSLGGTMEEHRISSVLGQKQVKKTVLSLMLLSDASPVGVLGSS